MKDFVTLAIRYTLYKSREQMEDCLEKWRQALERREMKRNGSRQKQDRIQEDVCPNGREAGRNVRVQGEEAVQVDGFNYSGGRGQPSRPMNRA